MMIDIASILYTTVLRIQTTVLAYFSQVAHHFMGCVIYNKEVVVA
jgi:hypothetical protein